MRHFVLMTAMFFIGLFNTTLAEEVNSCIKCHRRVTPLLVQQHLEGRMAKAGIGCVTCHGSDHNELRNAHLAKMPTAKVCAACHSKQAEQFKSGKHNLAWIAATSMPMMAHQPSAVTGEGYKGCSNCHKIGEKTEQELYVMFMEYRMCAVQGAFHFNPDYMHWYGWARMKKSLQPIESEADKLRSNRQ